MGDDEDKPDEEDDEDKPDDEEDEKCDPKDEDCEKPDGEEDEDKPDDEEDKPEDDEEKPDEEEDEEPEEPPFDPSVCPDPKHPVSWLANKYMKEMFTSNNAKFYQVNVPISKVDNIDVVNNEWTGFVMWPQKQCGAAFLDAVNNGDLTVDFFDTANLLEGGDVFKREEKGKQNAVVQFKVNKGDGDTAKAKVDQFWLSINGFGDVSFGNKDLSACMEAMVVGVTEGTYEGELGCIAYGKNFFG